MATEQLPAEPAAQKLYEAGRAAAQRHIVIPARGRGRGGRGGLSARSRGRGRGHGRAHGGVDESDNESDDKAADESDAEATASEDPGLDDDEAGDAASDAEDAEDDLPLVLQGRRSVSGQCADDTKAFLSDCHPAMVAILTDARQRFAHASGQRTHLGKSRVLFAGSCPAPLSAALCLAPGHVTHPLFLPDTSLSIP
eukprot:365490-Chlamydomonas_euryale.AAC.12